MREWWRGAVIYQVYVRSFQDSDGDGVGDLPGVTRRLDYLEWLGVDAIWLSPCFPSPNRDWGYDVADYTSVAPELGGDAALDELIAAAGARGIRVLLDLVPNHTSDEHAWFREARASRDAARRDWYVWADPRRDGAPPNNWRSVFGGPAWTFDDATSQWYLHNFLPEQPDLNWWHDGVREAFDDILRFWFDRGIAGFRIDVAHALVKDRELRDNPPAGPADPPRIRRHGQREVYSMNRPEGHDVFRRWRRLADGYDGRLLLGETWVFELDRLASFYGDGDELQLAFNFPFIFASLAAAPLRRVVEETEALLPDGASPVWTASNHDVVRFPTRWCEGDPARVRCALLVLLALRGTAVLYYGDEIGMPQADVPYERLRDPVGLRRWPEEPGRDGARTPMQWSNEPGGGFTAGGAEPWLPLGDVAACNVAGQQADPSATLSFVRDLIRLRRAADDLAGGDYATLPAPPGVWAWRRGAGTVVAVNLSDEPRSVGDVHGTLLLSTGRTREGDAVEGTLDLGAWEGAVVA